MVGSLFLTFVVICVLEDYNYAGAFLKTLSTEIIEMLVMVLLWQEANWKAPQEGIVWHFNTSFNIHRSSSVSEH